MGSEGVVRDGVEAAQVSHSGSDRQAQIDEQVPGAEALGQQFADFTTAQQQPERGKGDQGVGDGEQAHGSNDTR